MTNWKMLLETEMQERGETLADLVSNTLSDEEMTTEFYGGHKGKREGVPFTAWSENTVYFPVCYDGSEWVGSVSRHPDGKSTLHQGA